MTSSQLPRHIAVIMDGNGRWAKQRFMPRILGHRAGIEATRKIVVSCAKKNIQVLSLFAFSSENWRRPTDEVSFLMDLLLTALNREVEELHKNNVQLRFIGERSRLNEKLRQKLLDAENFTKNNKG